MDFTFVIFLVRTDFPKPRSLGMKCIPHVYSHLPTWAKISITHIIRYLLFPFSQTSCLLTMWQECLRFQIFPVSISLWNQNQGRIIFHTWNLKMKPPPAVIPQMTTPAHWVQVSPQTVLKELCISWCETAYLFSKEWKQVRQKDPRLTPCSGKQEAGHGRTCWFSKNDWWTLHPELPCCVDFK